MDPEEWLQVPAGSKRPSPSPSEGEEDREIKKFRTQSSEVAEGTGFQNDEVFFPFTHFPIAVNSDNQPYTSLSNRHVYEQPLSATMDSIMDYGGHSAPFPAGNIDYGAYFGEEAATTAMDASLEANTWLDDFLRDPDQATASPEYTRQSGYLTTGNMANQAHTQDFFSMRDDDLSPASQDLGPEIVALRHVESIPIRRAPADDQVSQVLTTSLPEKDAEVVTHSDTCFGVVITSPVSSFTQDGGARCIPVDLKPIGRYFILRDQASGTHAGILNNSALLKILGQFSVRLQAALLIPEAKGLKQPVRTKSTDHNSANSGESYRIRIAVHGLKYDKKAIGKILSDAGLFLQHPSAAELLPEVEYDNPHYLLWSGAKMPRVEDLNMEIDGQIPSQDEMEDETRSSNLLRIFESAALAADGGGVTRLKVTPSPRLRSVLMSHQIASLAFMLEKESGFVEEPMFPPLWRTKRSERGAKLYRNTITRSLESRPYPIMGGILADDMGLGKTLSVLALICSSLDFHKTAGLSEKQSYRRTLIVAPKSTIHSWETQTSRHVYEGQLRVGTYHGSGRQGLAKELLDADVVITTYETLRYDFAGSQNNPIHSWDWLRVVLDEAHHVRNRSSQVFGSVCRLKAKYRWCLTGTPIHNSLDDYGALLSFIRVYPFQAKSQFMTYISKPVEAKEEMGIHRLQELVRATCLRRTKKQTLASGVLNLPLRTEMTCLVHLHPHDQSLYESVKRWLQKTAAGSNEPLRKHKSAKASEGNVMVLLNSLRLICNHGEDLVPQLAKVIVEKGLDSFTNRAQPQFHAKECSSCGGETDCSSDFSGSQDSLCVNCARVETTPSHSQLPLELGQRVHKPGFPSGSMGRSFSGKAVTPSAKVVALINNLRQPQSTSDQAQKPIKSVVFSYWVKMLDLIEQAMCTEKIGWQRIDGQTSLEGRRSAVSEFSSKSDCTVMLASIGSAAEGIDLTAASVVHLIEPHWNPMVEAQAVDRVYRIGQTRNVTVIRYVVPDSVETYVQHVQQEKMNIINQTNSTRYITESDLAVARKKELEKILA